VSGTPPGDPPECPPVNISEMLAQTFILIAEQQRAFLEHQRQQSQIIEALQQAIIERPLPVNYIAVEVKGDVITTIPQPSGKGAVIGYAFLSILSLAIALGTGWWRLIPLSQLIN
jgi:hypothetical protein